jgi:ABC-type dipeptide/oligopeptide/nickel transport system permease component
MIKFLLRRLAFIPLVLIIVNFAGYAFAHVTYQLQQSQTIYGSGQEGIIPVWPEYTEYARGALLGDFGRMPIGVNEPISRAVIQASGASLGLLLISFFLSTALGLTLGLSAVKVDPPRTMPWLTLVSTIGLAMPSFYIGILFVGGLLYLTLRGGGQSILPVSGFGWDHHLVLPVIALTIRPMMQIAQVTASLLSGELDKRYVMAARSFGHTWNAIRWNKALRNVLGRVILVFAGSFRLLAAELVLVEWLFNWPGIGRMLVHTLVPPRISSVGGLVDTSAYFLEPPLVAGLLVVFALLFLLADLFSSGFARLIDPRLRNLEEEPSRG